MKHLIILILAMSAIFFGAESQKFSPKPKQMNYPSYEEQWKQVAQLENDGKTKDASARVEEIYQLAKRENNTPQIYKTLLKLANYTTVLEEDAELTIVNRFKEVIAVSELPTKQLLQSSLGQIYWDYFQRNRYQFYNRTTTTAEPSAIEGDFRTWDLARIIEESDAQFTASIQPSTNLSAYQIEDFIDILNNVDTTFIKYRPTLYDLLAHKAIQFYANDESGMNKPADQFQIRDEQAFGPLREFLSYSPKTTDTASFKLKSLRTYQDLLRYKQSANDWPSLIHTNLERLKYVHNNTNLPNKDERYEKALKNYLATNPHEEISLAGYALAGLYQQQGSQYNAHTAQEDDENRWKLTEAIKVCEQMMEKYPNTLGANNCANLREDILFKEANLTFEKHVSPHQPIKMLVRQKNFDELHFRLIKVQDKWFNEFKALETSTDREQFLVGLDYENAWQIEVPNSGDHQFHSFESVLQGYNAETVTEKKLGLAPGKYYVLSSLSENFEVDLDDYQQFQVTSIAYLTTETLNGQDLFLMNRETSEPIANASIQLTRWDRGKIQNRINRKTDKEGRVTIQAPERYYRYDLEVTTDGDSAYFQDYTYSENRKYQPTWRDRGYLFTDRAIYRPGQTVYFKAILTTTNGQESKLKDGRSVNVSLKDANYEEVEKLNLRSNEFGSIQGSFTIPQGRLLGRYQIVIPEFGSTSISVEEYKRPKFQVEMEPLQGNFRLNETISAEGKAIAYAGSNITNAEVNYRVVRQARYPYWFSWYRFYPPVRSESQEIAFGTTTTDDQGRFEIPFKAIPDESLDPKDLPVFDYRISVDVTDINGETRSTQTTVVAGYTALALSINNPSWQRSEDVRFNLQTQNLNGQPVSAKGKVEVFKLNAPGDIYRTRPWNIPDLKELTESEYKNLFPHDAYKVEDTNTKNWENGERVFQDSFTTNDDGMEKFSMSAKKLKPGYYRIVAETKDVYGNEIESQNVVYLTGEVEDDLPDNQLFTWQLDKATYEVGETATLTLKTGANDLWLWVDVTRDHDRLRRELVHLKNDCATQIEIPITEKDRGGLGLSYGFVKYNGQFVGTNQVSVPWKNKDLTIEVSTFRDKLKPGAEETWSFTVKGEQGDRVSAEFLAAMYDSSLDQFVDHNWSFFPGFRRQGYGRAFRVGGFGLDYLNVSEYGVEEFVNQVNPYFPSLSNFGFYLGSNRYMYRNRSMSAPAPSVDMAMEGELLGLQMEDAESVRDEVVVTGESVAEPKEKDKDSNGGGGDAGDNAPLDVVARKNLQETAFFLPQLLTDKEGNVTFSFTTPEALTEWKVMALAHTKELQYGQWTGNTVTQKELMVIPNAPRFLRQGDKITFATKIANLQDKDINGQAELVLLDATTLKPVYSKIGKTTAVQNFTIAANGNTQVEWNLQIPDDVPAVTYRVLAKAGNFSDGEENALPILSNRKLVTETMPIALRSNQTKTFVLDKLANNSSNTLKHHKLTLEMTSNPAWYGVQALPYLMEFPYECAEQTFSRYYANSIATHVANSNPKIKSVFDTWRNYQPDALKSNLEKNQELKELMLRETPWVRAAQNESEQKRRIALLFDLNRMAGEQQKAINQLQQLQMGSGGWPWFAGGNANRFISQHIIAGMGHLDALEVKQVREDSKTWNMTKRGVSFLDAELAEDLSRLKRNNENWRDITSVSYIIAHYFYVRSYFLDVPVADQHREAYDFYWGKLKEDWLSDQLYRNGLVSLAFHRNGETELANKIVTALDQNSITSEELGMYWKNNRASWWWYQAPIETQALMIEVFDEVADDQNAVDELKVWLLKNKQTNSWETTKATAEAVYALLLRGGEWLAVDDLVQITVGDQKIDPNELDDVGVEAGTGYFKTSWSGGEVTNEMATVKTTKTGEGIAWGALYWQYFEDLDKITSAETPLKLNKKLFLQENTSTGPKISPIAEGQTLEIGDLLKVRIELRVDRDMEFVHMKDLRAAGFEPTNVLSRYKWQDGLGYYESTKDASTDFFFDFLPKGVYVFEYPLRVNNAGDMSNGITSIQCMYAPEFTSHSEGVRVNVE